MGQCDKLELMRHLRIEELPETPVTHMPGIKKHVFAEDVSCVKSISHVELHPGDTAGEHSHAGACEVFFLASGEVVFGVNGEEVRLRERECLVIEPGDRHSITAVVRPSGLFYFLAESV